MDWFDLLAVQGTLKSLLQFKSINSWVLSFPYGLTLTSYMTARKTTALTRWTFVGKVMFLLFNMLSRLVTAFLPRSKCLNFMAAVTICSDFGAPPQKQSLSLFPLFAHLFAIKWWDWMPWSQFSEFWVLSQLFHSLFHFHQEALQFFFTFCHKGGVICISEVIDISPGNLDSILCFIQPSISHDVLCI